MGTFFGLIGLGFVILLTLAMNKTHKEQTGVNAPSSKAFNRFYRKAAENGTTVEHEYQQ